MYQSFRKLVSQLEDDRVVPTNIPKLKQYLLVLWECLGDSYFCENEYEEVVNFQKVLNFLFSENNKINQVQNPSGLWYIGGFHCLKTDNFCLNRSMI